MLPLYKRCESVMRATRITQRLLKSQISRRWAMRDVSGISPNAMACRVPFGSEKICEGLDDCRKAKCSIPDALGHTV